MRHPLPAKFGNYFANKRLSLGRYTSLADSGLGVQFEFSVMAEGYTDSRFRAYNKFQYSCDSSLISVSYLKETVQVLSDNSRNNLNTLPLFQ
jgi:hypothetical protein